jgi:hypothetical protein
MSLGQSYRAQFVCRPAAEHVSYIPFKNVKLYAIYWHFPGRNWRFLMKGEKECHINISL